MLNRNERSVISVLLVLLIVILSSTAFAVQENNKEVEVEVSEEFLQQRIETVNNIMNNYYSGRNSKKNTIDKLKKMGFQFNEDIFQAEDVTTLSVPDGNVTMYTPGVMYDAPIGKWVATASFGWNNTNWKADFPTTWPRDNQWRSLGGLNGFGFYFNKRVIRHSEGFTVQSNNYVNTSYSLASFASPNGVAWEKQDLGRISLDMSYYYNWHFGSASFYFTPDETGTYTVHSGLCHTWNATATRINGIAAWGISWNTNTQQNQWSVISSPRQFSI